MKIELEQAGKRYRTEWVLRGIDLCLLPGRRYAVTGPNGSGKSTLLRLLSGHLTPSRGAVRFSYEGRAVPVSEVYRHLAYAAPYIELIEEFTLQEALQFHRRFQPYLPGLSDEAMLDLLAFPRARHKPVRHFSSGMKQRLKLALALGSDTSLLLLDEPTTNLDRQGVEWYRALVDRFAGERLVVVASNVEVDYEFCEEGVDILGFK